MAKHKQSVSKLALMNVYFTKRAKMLFPSVQFLFFFFPLVFFIYVSLPNTKWQNYFLLFASIVFYSWLEFRDIFILVATVISSYYAALHIQKNSDIKKKRSALVLGIFFNLSILFFFKYSHFIFENLNYLLGIYAVSFKVHLKPYHLPLGISFFIFHALSYMIDSYRSQIVAEKRFSVVALYFFLFPHQIAGPIVRYVHFAKDADSRLVTLNDIEEGLIRFTTGLAKKVLIANSVAGAADYIFGSPIADISTPLAWLGVICYTVQIYFDFSGYSDMAIGLARLFGFHFHENFNYPYGAKTITEFWRKWHISLSTWFRDYLYIPLGGNRVSTGRTYLNLIIVFSLCGLWHGASWTFLVWGLWHGTFLVLERVGLEKLLQKYKMLANLWTILIVMLGWVFFRASNLEDALKYIGRLFSFSLNVGDSNYNLYFISSPVLYLGLILGIFIANGHVGNFFQKLRTNRQNLSYLWIIILLVLSIVRLSSSTFNPFIYFRF